VLVGMLRLVVRRDGAQPDAWQRAPSACGRIARETKWWCGVTIGLPKHYKEHTRL